MAHRLALFSALTVCAVAQSESTLVAESASSPLPSPPPSPVVSVSPLATSLQSRSIVQTAEAAGCVCARARRVQEVAALVFFHSSTPILFSPLPISCFSLTTLVSTLNTAGLLPTFDNPGTFTIFAPTNAAFSALGGPLLDWLTNARSVNRRALTNTLLFHALSSTYYFPGLPFGIFPISKQNLCPTCIDDYGLSVYYLYNTSARAATVRRRAFYGSEVLATFTTSNITCSNGAMHVVDAVLVPSKKSDLAIPTLNVTQKVRNLRWSEPPYVDFSALASALNATGLSSVLTAGDGIYTVFAPSDDAFAAVPTYILSNMTLLKQVLLYHVISGRTYKEDLPANVDLNTTTLLGQTIKIQSSTVTPAGVTIVGNAPNNKANVFRVDVDSTNAVLHLIDTVRVFRGGAKLLHSPLATTLAYFPSFSFSQVLLPSGLPPAPDDPAAPSISNNAGAIVGGVIGGIAVLGTLAGFGFYWKKVAVSSAAEYSSLKANALGSNPYNMQRSIELVGDC